MKKIGRGGGAEEVRNYKNLKKMKILSPSCLTSKNNVAKKVMTLTITTSSTKIKVDRMISGSFTVLFIIFLIILPRCVVKPVLIIIAKVLPTLVYKILDP